MKNKSILVICAHNDDQIIGVGGTIAKYASEGAKVKTIIFAYGELSHPHLKPEVIIKKRVKESRISDKILGGAGVMYLGIQEPKFAEIMNNKKEKKKILDTLRRIIAKNKPIKIFTHSRDDPHPLHRKVHEIVTDITKNVDAELYSFDVWNVIKLRNRNKPKLVVDITKTFNKKIRAFKSHKSQKMTLWTLLWNVYMKAMLNGWSNNCKYAEVFRKLK